MAIQWTPVEFTAKVFVTFTRTRITLMCAAPGFAVRSTKAPSIRDNCWARRARPRVAKQEAGVLAARVDI
jgi:hypothetical protein